MDQETTRDVPPSGIDKEEHFATGAAATTWGNPDDLVDLVFVTHHNFMYARRIFMLPSHKDMLAVREDHCVLVDRPFKEQE